VTVRLGTDAATALNAAGGRLVRGLTDWIPAAIVFLALIGLWQFVVVAFEVKRFVLPAPLAIGEAFATYFSEIWAAGTYTAVEAVGGLVVGAGLGLLVGLITARWVAMRESLLPFAILFNSVPIIAFAPIMNNWFGLANPASKMAISAILVFFPVMINTVRGLVQVEPAALELMRATAASELDILRKVRLPNALPYIFTSLKVAATLATIGAIVAEYFGAPRASLGQYIAQHAAYFNFERSWAAIVIAAALGIGLYLTVVVAERLVMPWHSSFRAQEV
jgi:NitT/TauT family transport system permease protein